MRNYDFAGYMGGEEPLWLVELFLLLYLSVGSLSSHSLPGNTPSAFTSHRGKSVKPTNTALTAQ